MKTRDHKKPSEVQKNQKIFAPPRVRDKVIKVLTLTLLLLIILFSIGFFGVEQTTSSQFCSSCHEMAPEFYTWKASSHSEVDCVNCHTGPNPKGYAKAKTSGLVQFFNKNKQTYSTDENMSKEIKDKVCEKCHNLTQREVTPTGDLIIPHDKHKTKKIHCIQCHSGTAHGNVTERKMTLAEDYDKWNVVVGIEAMKDPQYIKPSMESCIKCHQEKSEPLECIACHTSGMYPETHEDASFKEGQHGKWAKMELQNCLKCHSLMSREKVIGFDKNPTLSHFIKIKNEIVKKNQYDYAKENSFCRDCHSQRPISHTGLWMMEHGGNAIEDSNTCFTCHDKQSSENTTNTVTCTPCHNNNDKRWLYLITPRD